MGKIRLLIGGLVVVMSMGGIAMAGNLEPPGPPGPTMWDLGLIATIVDENQGNIDDILYNLDNEVIPTLELEVVPNLENVQYVTDVILHNMSQTGKFLIPSWWETSSPISSANATDTEIRMFHLAGLENVDGGSLTAFPTNSLAFGAYLYLFDETGAILESGTASEVCNPCTFNFNETTPFQIIRIQDLVDAAGGFAGPDQSGSAIVALNNWVENFALTVEVVSTHSSALEVTRSSVTPIQMRAVTP